jgi:hypothetical protein
MFTYTFSLPCTRTPSNSNSRASFAHDAALDAFGARARWTLDDPEFEDRRPNEAPPPAGEFFAWLEMIGAKAR